MSKTHGTILEPVITEKSTALTHHHKYTFKVSRTATKSSIKKSVLEIFPTRKVLSIQTLKIKGHAKRTKSGIKHPIDCKKAIITLEGAKIEYFPEIS